MKNVLSILAAGVLSSTIVPNVILNTNLNISTSSSNSNDFHVNLKQSNFRIGSSLEKNYSEEFDLTALTGIYGWGEFTNKYHYFAWDGADWQRNNWYFGAIVLQCQQDGVKNSTLKLDTIPNARRIPINNSTFMEDRVYTYSITGYWQRSSRYDPYATSFNTLYYGGYYFNDDNGDLWYGVSVNAQESGGTTAKFTFNVGTYASFWN